MFSVKLLKDIFFIFRISINDLSEQVRFSSYNWQAKVRWIPQDDKITQYFDMIRMVFRCIYDRNLNNFYLCHKMRRTMAPLSMLKADIVWLNHINCLLMVFILEILHIVIRIQRQEIKNDLERSCPALIRPIIYINISFLIYFSFKKFHFSEMYRKLKPSWSHYHWPHFQIILRDLTFPMLITHLPATVTFLRVSETRRIWVMWCVPSAWDEKPVQI